MSHRTLNKYVTPSPNIAAHIVRCKVVDIYSRILFARTLYALFGEQTRHKHISAAAGDVHLEQIGARIDRISIALIIFFVLKSA